MKPPIGDFTVPDHAFGLLLLVVVAVDIIVELECRVYRLEVPLLWFSTPI